METKEINKVKEELRELMPEYIAQERESIQEAWVEREFIQWKLDHLEERYFSFVNLDGEEKEVDLIRNKPDVTIKELGGEEGDQKKAINIRNYKIKPLLKELEEAGKRLDTIYGRRYGRAVAEHAEEILDYFSEYHTIKDIIRLMKMKYSININNISLKLFYQDNKQVIEKKRLQFIARRQDFTIATDSGRLGILNDLLVTWKEKFDQDQKLAYSKEIRAVLEQARKEIKGDQLFLTVEGKIDINATIQAQENVSQSLQRLPINLLVIGMVAAKVGVNPADIIYELSSSYYRDKNGFNPLQSHGTNTLPGEFIRNIAWETLGEYNTNWEKRREAYEEAVIVEEPANRIEVNEKRKQLLQLLRASRDRDLENIKKQEKVKTKAVVRKTNVNKEEEKMNLISEMKKRKNSNQGKGKKI